MRAPSSSEIRPFEVVLWLCDGGFGAPHADHRVGGFVVADRARVVGQVRDVEQELLLAGGGRATFLVERDNPVAHRLDLGLGQCGILTAGEAGADLLGRFLAFGLQGLLVGLGAAADLVAT